MHGVAVATGLTVEDVWAIPDDGQRRELIEGALFVSPAPKPSHQHVLLRVLDVVRAAAGPRRVLFAPVDIVVDDRTIVQPDLVMWSQEDSERLAPDGDPRDTPVPELVVEVSSPSTKRVDLIYKRRLYERIGVREYWFVDRDERAVDVYVFGEGDEIRTATGGDPLSSSLLSTRATVDEILAW